MRIRAKIEICHYACYKFNFKLLRQGMASLQEQLFIAAMFVKKLMVTVINL